MILNVRAKSQINELSWIRLVSYDIENQLKRRWWKKLQLLNMKHSNIQTSKHWAAMFSSFIHQLKPASESRHKVSHSIHSHWIVIVTDDIKKSLFSSQFISSHGHLKFDYCAVLLFLMTPTHPITFRFDNIAFKLKLINISLILDISRYFSSLLMGWNIKILPLRLFCIFLSLSKKKFTFTSSSVIACNATQEKQLSCTIDR